MENEFETTTIEDLATLMSAHYDGNDNGKKEVLLHGENSKAIAETEGCWRLVYDSTNRRNIADFPHDWSLYVSDKNNGMNIHFCTAMMGILSPGDAIMTTKLFSEQTMESLVEIIAEKDPTLAVDMNEWKARQQVENEPKIEQQKTEAEEDSIDKEREAKIKVMQLSDMKDALEFFVNGKSVKNGAEFLLNDNVRKGNWVVVKHAFDREMNPVHPSGWTLSFQGKSVCECRDNRTLEILDKGLDVEQFNALAATVDKIVPGLETKWQGIDDNKIEYLKKNAKVIEHRVNMREMLENKKIAPQIPRGYVGKEM